MVESPLTCNRFEPVERGVLCFLRGQELKTFSKEYLNDIIRKSNASVLKTVNQSNYPSSIGFLLQESDASYFRRYSNQKDSALFKMSTCGNAIPSKSIESLVSESTFESGLIVYYSGKPILDSKVSGMRDINYDEFLSKFNNQSGWVYGKKVSDFGNLFVAKKGDIEIVDEYDAFNLKDCPYKLVKDLEDDVKRRDYYAALGLDCPFEEHKFTYDGINFNGFSSLFETENGFVAIHASPGIGTNEKKHGFVSVNVMNCNIKNVKAFCNKFNPAVTEHAHIDSAYLNSIVLKESKVYSA